MELVLLVLTCILCIVAFFILFLEGRAWKKSSRRDGRQGLSNRRRLGNSAARRYQQRSAVSTSRSPQLMTESDFDSLSEGSDDDGSTKTDSEAKLPVMLPKKKVGAKKAQKLAEKERRKEEREMEERYREAMRKKEDEEIKKRKDTEAKEAAAEAAQAAAEEKLRLEREMREQAKYEQLKATFSIEGEGVGIQPLDEEAERRLNHQFVEAVKEAKLISLERLCVMFDMKTDACVEKIQWLISEGALSGVLDDRGKFLCIEPKEYEAIAKFIELRGRVTMRELVEHGNKVVKARANVARLILQVE
ncbi:DDRGK domain-containing protein [Echinococcus granulosus]|uniref:DDRGK domain-containing protein 1 n=2 Tax=Echinococcus granulosus TaxID=6210 RepID=W6UMB3_ECHGR|nr:DDRGK domain-containing protein [Echinococcus granulosus]EUB62198.1 DDRGK domain-containing protein [Echinococcus granulosus]